MARRPDPRDSVVVASISGGKDSTALSLYLRERGIAHRRVFADTGWEHATTYKHVEYLETVLGPIDRVRSVHGGMVDVVRWKRMFPSRLKRFCTQELKAYPIKRYLGEHDCEVNAVGIRAAESQARAKLTEWEWSREFDCWVWRPLIKWSEAKVIAIHKRHGVRPNPLYLQGAERVGCWPCIFSRKAEIRLVADTDPTRIDEIAALEHELDGPTFFHTKSHDPAKQGALPIQGAVDWSRTARGGKRLAVLSDAPPDGCLRWGMCE